MVPDPPYTDDEMMTVAAARQLHDGAVCFVGIGLPSLAANLARRLHAPHSVLVYESGALGVAPERPPLSIGDPELAETATALVGVPEVFAYWLQGGRIDVGFLGAAQIDRHANINTTVIGDYDRPSTRLPGAGGAPEIATSARRVIVLLRHRRRAFAETLDFVTSAGHLDGVGARRRHGLPGAGPDTVITDLGVLTVPPGGAELVLTAVHPGIDVEAVRDRTGWPLAVAAELAVSAEPSAEELAALRAFGG